MGNTKEHWSDYVWTTLHATECINILFIFLVMYNGHGHPML